MTQPRPASRVEACPWCGWYAVIRGNGKACLWCGALANADGRWWWRP